MAEQLRHLPQSDTQQTQGAQERFVAYSVKAENPVEFTCFRALEPQGRAISAPTGGFKLKLP